MILVKIFTILTCWLLVLSKANDTIQNNEMLDEDYIADRNYTKVLKGEFLRKKSTNIIAVLFTNKNCQTCSVFEPEMKQIMKAFQLESIPIFRCQISQNPKLVQKFKVKRFPIIDFVIKRKSEQSQKGYEIQIYRTSQVLIMRVLESAKYLKRILDFEYQSQNNLISMVKTLDQVPKMSIIAINYERFQKEYGLKEKELTNIMFKEVFNSMMIVPLSQELFQFYMLSNSIQSSDFDSNPSTSLPELPTMIISIQTLKTLQYSNFQHIQVQDNQIIKFLESSQNFQLMFKSFLLRTCQEFKEDIYQIQRQIQTMEIPSVRKIKKTYLTVLDSIWNRESTLTQITNLNKIMLEFDGQAVIYWTQGQINTQKKTLLGFRQDDQPPLLGRLILQKNAPKQPLIDQITKKPIFTTLQIKKMIKSDLGYEKGLIQKIKQSIQDLELLDLLSIQSKIELSENSNKIIFAYCTSQNVRPADLNELAYLITRFKRFYPNASMTVLTSPCQIGNIQKRNGLYLVFRNQIEQISQTISECLKLQQNIQQITNKMAVKINRKKLVPHNFCIQQNQMRQFLMESLS